MTITGDDYCYGWDTSHEMEHSVYNATGGITNTFDHGHADEEVTDAQITAAWEATLAGAGNVGDLADSDEDEGGSDDDEEGDVMIV